MSSLLGRARLPALLALVATACGGDAPLPLAERADSAGIEIVTFSTLESRGALSVSAAPEVWIQGDARIPPFGRISGVVMLSDGRVLVADGGANQVHAFSPQGDYLWSAGKEGDGPGEFKRLAALYATAADTIVAVDAGLTRVTVLAPSGDYVRDGRFPDEAGQPAALLAGGALLYLRERRAGEIGLGVSHSVATWAVVAPADDQLHTLTTTPGNDSYYGQADQFRVVMRPDFLRHAWTAPAGEGFYLALSDQPRVDRYGPDGLLVRSVRLPEAALTHPVDDPQAMRDHLLESAPPPMRAGLAKIVADIPVPEVWPPVGGLLADDGGRLWVEAANPSSESSSTWYVFTADGTYVDRVAMPAGFEVRTIRHGLVAGVWKDEMDVESVRVYRVNGGGG